MKRTVMALALAVAVSALGASRDMKNRRQQRGSRPSDDPVVNALDTNGDGIVDAKEIAHAAAALRKLDRNGDGKLAEDELMPFRQGRSGKGGRSDFAGNGQGERNGSGWRGGPGDDGSGPGDAPPGGDGSGPSVRGMGGPGGFGPPPSDESSCTLSGAFAVTGKTLRTTGQTYASDRDDVSAVYVSGGGDLTLVAPKISTTGNTSSQNDSSFCGLNAAVLAGANGRVAVIGGSIRTQGEGANAAFATGKGAEVRLSKVTLFAAGEGGHGVMASGGGRLELDGVDITTLREHGAALATDRGGGTIVARGGAYNTAGDGSPGIYSTGRIVVSNGVFKSTGAEAAVIEGENSIDLTDCSLTAGKLCGAMLYQSFSGDAEGRNGRFTMRGGSLTAAAGPVFRVTNAKGFISLTGVKLSAASGVLVCANGGRWGESGANGGRALLTAEAQVMDGDLVCDSISAVEASLTRGSVLTGKVGGASLSLDASSKWVVTGDSRVQTLAEEKGSVANIVGNGRVVTYNAALAANAWLKGRTLPLAGGGRLEPAKR